MTPARRVRLFGDSALVIDTTTVDDAHALAAAIDTGEWPGVEEVIVGFRSVTVVVDPTVSGADTGALGHEFASLVAALAPASAGALVDIPVMFDGRDLDDVARLARLSPAEVVALLTGTELRVAFVGFAPGFGYLVGLPPDLAAVPRRPTPRPQVPSGSVALAGGFAGVYPQTSPGGWHIVGRTDRPLFDPAAAPYSVLRAGDRVRLRETPPRADAGGDADVGRDGYVGPPTVGRRPLRTDAGRRVVIEDAGLLSLVQDGGRVGAARLGVPRAGATDPFARRVANRLVGNDENAAVIEATARVPTLRFSDPTHVAVVGATETTVDGRRVPGATIVPVGADETMSGVVGPGLRAFIAVGGGIDIPTVLGSRSSDVLSGLGVGPLARGDILGLGPRTHPRGRALPVAVATGGAALRVMVGPDIFPAPVVERLLSTVWEVDETSNRVGVRLRSDPPLEAPTAAIDSRGMVTGAIQLPPDGRPIVLLCDHATVGGYPVIATVVSADIGVLGQLRPGDAVHLEPVDLAEAVRARAVRERGVSDGVVGWYPVRTD